MVIQWAQDLPKRPSNPHVEGLQNADVCVIGAGLAGLWATYWLLERSPGLSVVLVDADRAGTGAAGRNAGWLTAKLPGPTRAWARTQAELARLRALQFEVSEAVVQIPDLLGADRIEACASGFLQVARSPAELHRLEHARDDLLVRGLPRSSLRVLDAGQTRDRVAVDGALGALFCTQGTRVHPGRLAEALLDAVLLRGARLHENSPVLRVDGRTAVTEHGRITARTVVITTETGLGTSANRLIRLHAGLGATAPLSTDQWAEIGWEGAECVGGAAHAYFYAQRTRDDRIIYGHGSLPYRRRDPLPTDLAGLREEYRRGLEELFPQAGPLPLESLWWGSIGVTRDWVPAVLHDPVAGRATIRGLAGQGVATSFVAGRDLADLILAIPSAATSMPWTNRHPRRWPPHPLRWVGSRLAAEAYRRADLAEAVSGRPTTARLARLADRISGIH